MSVNVGQASRCRTMLRCIIHNWHKSFEMSKWDKEQKQLWQLDNGGDSKDAWKWFVNVESMIWPYNQRGHVAFGPFGYRMTRFRNNHKKKDVTPSNPKQFFRQQWMSINIFESQTVDLETKHKLAIKFKIYLAYFNTSHILISKFIYYRAARNSISSCWWGLESPDRYQGQPATVIF